MRPKNCTQPRRVVRTFEEDIVSSEPRKTLREIVDRMLVGDNPNATLSQHKPLPPDSIDDEDFDNVHEEPLDIIEQQAYEDELLRQQQQLQDAQNEQLKSQQSKAFEEAVATEVAKRMSQQQE